MPGYVWDSPRRLDLVLVAPDGGVDHRTAQLARLFGVPFVRLLQPPREVTHVKVGPFKEVPASDYLADFFADPRGAGRGIPVERRLADKPAHDLREQMASSPYPGLNDLEVSMEAVGLKEHHEKLMALNDFLATNVDEDGQPKISAGEWNAEIQKLWDKLREHHPMLKGFR